MMTFKEPRERSGMSRKQFAEYFEIPYRTIQNWENGVRTPSEWVVELIAFRVENDKELAAQKQKMLDKANGIIKPAHKPHKHNPLERQPQKDICDFRLEENYGIYCVGGKKGKVRFSR